MSEKTHQHQEPSEPPIINFIKIKQWYVPADDPSYRVLRDLKMPLLKVHRDYLPLLELQTSKRGIRAKSRNFEEILHERLDRVGEAWNAKKGRKCQLTESRLSFSAPATDRNRKAIAQLESSFARFCLRWGHRYVPSYSETADRIKLVIDYSFDPDRNPVIESGADDMRQKYELELGFTKLSFTFMDKPPATKGGPSLPPIIHMDVSQKMGTEWRSIHTTSFVNQQIGDLSQFFTVMSKFHDRRMILEQGGAVGQDHPVPKNPNRPDVVAAMREIVKGVEETIIKLVFADKDNEILEHARALVSLGRKIPRLNAGLADSGIKAELTRERCVAWLDKPGSLWPYFFDPDNEQAAIPMSHDVIDRACVLAFDKVKRIKTRWLELEFMTDPHGAVEALIQAL